MRNEEIKVELAALRAEVVALAEAREQAPKPAAEPDSSAVEDGGSETEDEGLMAQVHELVELLENELRETPMVSGLVIFSLGILVGRFLR